MFRLSKKLAKLEDRIAGRWGKKLDRFQSRHKGEWKYLIPLGLVAWYFAGMLLNSIRLGIQSVFGADSDQIKGNHRGGRADVLSHHQKRVPLVFGVQVHPG